jgi:hypothetical protein
LGIDPDTLEVRIRIRGPGEQEKSPDGGSTAKAAAREAGGRKLSGKLLEAFSLLCQAGERFMSYMGEGRLQGSEATGPAAAPGEVAPDDQGGPKARAEEHESRRKEAGRTDPSSTDDRDVERSATFGGEVHQETEVSNGRPGVQWEASEDKGERRNLAVLTLKVFSALA